MIYFPLLVVVLNSFNADSTFGWPPSALTLEWWDRAIGNEGALRALTTSIKAGLVATAIALVLGTMAAFALQRSSSSLRPSRCTWRSGSPATTPPAAGCDTLKVTFCTHR